MLLCKFVAAVVIVLLLGEQVLSAPLVAEVQKLSDVRRPAVPPLRSSCMVRVNSTAEFPLASKRVLIPVSAGAASFSVTTALQYFVSRGASVDLACIRPHTPGTPQVLLEEYYPTFVINLVSCVDPAAVNGSEYDAIVLVPGYEHVLFIRQDASVRTLVRDFLLSAAAAPRALIALDEGIELLIEMAGLISSIKGFLPTPTFAFESAAAAENATGVSWVSNVSVALLDVLPSAGVSTSGVVVAATNSAEDGDGVLRLLSMVSERVFQFAGDFPVASPCSDEIATTNFTIPPNLFSDVTDAVASSWTAYQNVGIFGSMPSYNASAPWSPSTFPLDISEACTNDDGENTCAGHSMAVVVAHGSHDMQVIPLLAAIAAVGAVADVYCPDTDEGHGVVYAMPYPSLVPTYTVTCTHFYNESILVFENFIFVVGGAIATHRRLLKDNNLLLALDSASPSYAFYGTALVLLGPIFADSAHTSPAEVSSTPSCVFTDTDLKNAGLSVIPVTSPFNVTASGVAHFQNPHTNMEQRQLGGYPTIDVLMASFPLFCQQTVSNRAWNTQRPSKVDHVVGAVVISAAVLLVVGVLAVKLVERRLKAARGGAYVNLQRSEDVEIFA